MKHLSNHPDMPTAHAGLLPVAVRCTASRWPALLALVSALCWTMLAGAPTASAAVTVIPSGATVISASGGSHNCAVLEDMTARCWGLNDHGQLGDGTTFGSSTPVAVSGLTDAIAISASGVDGHTCALLEGSTAKCWGWNDEGQLGDGTTTDSSTPVAVSGLSEATAVSAGGWHTCALLEGGTARCWGFDAEGQLGDGFPLMNSSTPVTVSGLSEATAISAGFSHTCALLEGGTAKCWGDNEERELGDGTNSIHSPAPVTVSGLSDAIAISAGGFFSCALLEGGTAKCWGRNLFGEIGNGTSGYAAQPVPVQVSGLSDAIAISAGHTYACALLEGGTAKCWGDNTHDQLGNRTSSYYSSTPVPVYGLNNATAISAGDVDTCALLEGGTVECWGYNYGPREIPAEPSSSSPTPPQTPQTPVTPLTPPKAKITSHPPKETAGRSASFAFTGVAGGTYECSVDAGPWRSCRSGEDFGPLLPGDHRFRVRETLNGLTGPADSYSWTIDLPRACVLRVARARVFVFTHQHRVRLVIHYKTYRPAKVTVAYKLLGRRGGLKLGKAASHFKTAGIFRLSERLDKRAIAKVRATRLMKVAFRIPRTPHSCGRYYAKRLTIPKKVFGQTVWFQSDSIFTS